MGSHAILKSAGISGPPKDPVDKITYLRDLADKVLTGAIDFHRLPELSDE